MPAEQSNTRPRTLLQSRSPSQVRARCARHSGPPPAALGSRPGRRAPKAATQTSAPCGRWYSAAARLAPFDQTTQSPRKGCTNLTPPASTNNKRVVALETRSMQTICLPISRFVKRRTVINMGTGSSARIRRFPRQHDPKKVIFRPMYLGTFRPQPQARIANWQYELWKQPSVSNG